MDNDWIEQAVTEFFPRHFPVGSQVIAATFWERGLSMPPSGKRYAISRVLARLRASGQIVNSGRTIASAVGHTGNNNVYRRVR